MQVQAINTHNSQTSFGAKVATTTENTIEKYFRRKSVVKNTKKVHIDINEMVKMNERLAKAEQEFRSKSAQSSMAVRKFFYNA